MHNSNYYKWFVLSVLFLAIVFGFGTMHMIAPLAQEIDKDIGLSLTQVGAAVAIFTLASPIVSPIAGILVDSISVRSILTFAVLLVGASCAMRGLVDSADMLLLMMFLGGVGFACYGPIIPKVLGTVFSSQEFGRANGIVFSGFWVGTTLALALSANVLSPMFDGWRGSMIFVGGLSVAIAIMWFLLFRDGTENADSSTELPSTPKSFAEVIRLPEIWYLSLYYAFFAAGFYAILSLLPSLLLQRGIENGGAYTSLIPLTMIISNIVGGMLSDRFGRVRVLIVCVLLFGVTIPTLLLFDGPLLAFSLILAGIAAGPILPVTTSLPMEMPRIGHVSAGTALGIFFMIGNTGAFLGPLLAGWLTQSSESPWLSFLIFMVLALLAPLFILQLNKTQSLETSKTASG